MRNPFLRSAAGRHGDDGFVLLESLVAISLIAVVMAALTTFFVGAVASTNTQRATQVATQLANSTVDTVRSLPASDPVNGHDASSVGTQFNAASSTVAPWLSSMTAAVDPNAAAGSGPTATVPTVGVPQTVNNILYSVNVYLGTCIIPAGQQSGAICAPAAASTGIGYLRAVVAVTWAGAHCPPTQCTYLTATLLSPVDDPLFNLNQSAPAAPTITNPGNQTSAVGDTVTLAPTISAVPTFRVTITAGSLPAGLSLDTTTGRITGQPGAVTPIGPVTLTLTDGFGRTATASFTWTVVPQLAGSPPPAQASLVGTPISPLTVTAGGGQGPYTWTDPTGSLPPGLSLSTSGVITGTPNSSGTLPQTFPVLLTVTDSAQRSATAPISWTISYPPFVVAVPGPQNSTVGVAIARLPLTVTGGSGSFSWSGGASLPAGLTLSSGGVISGVPTGNGATTSVTLTATDTKSVASTNPTVFASQSFTFSWAVFARPTITSPGNQVVTTGMPVNLQLGTSCPNTPCTYAVVNGPSGISINATGLVTGTITSPAQTFGNVTLTVTDRAGAQVSTAPFTLVVNSAPVFTGPGNLTTAPGATSVNAATLVTGGTGPLTFSATGLPAGLTISTAGLITGTAVTGTTTGVVLTVRDANGVTGSSSAFTWVVGGPPSAPLAVAVVNGDGTTAVSWTAPATPGGTITGYTVALGSGGGTCTTTGATSCSISGLTDGVVYPVTVTATNSFGVGPASAAINAIPFPAVMSAANGMTLWLDGADPTVLFASSNCTGAVATASTPVACWKDKSTQGENFNQTVAANQPTVGTWNKLSAPNFADSTDVLNSINGNDTYQTVFVAANVANPAAASGVIVDLFGQATQDFDVRVGTGANRNSPNGNDWSYNTGSTPTNWLDSAQAVNAAQPLALITSDQSAGVQSFAASVSNTFLSRGIVGQVGDVITFNRVLTTAQRRAVEEYLGAKWGVVVTPRAPSTPSAARTGSGNAAITWSAPAYAGGAPVTGYTVTSSGGQTCTTTALTCTVPGLISGRAYTFSVTATNSAGTGPPSAASNSVTA